MASENERHEGVGTQPVAPVYVALPGYVILSEETRNQIVYALRDALNAFTSESGALAMAEQMRPKWTPEEVRNWHPCYFDEWPEPELIEAVKEQYYDGKPVEECQSDNCECHYMAMAQVGAAWALEMLLKQKADG